MESGMRAPALPPSLQNRAVPRIFGGCTGQVSNKIQGCARMWYGQPVCGPEPQPNATPPQNPFSLDVTRNATRCLFEERGSFYDGCANECVMDKSMLRLSHHEQLEEVIYGKIFPVLIFFVVVANLTVAVVLSKKHMLSPTNVVLKYMAIADLFVGLVPLPWTLYYFTMGNNHHPEKLAIWWCYMAKYSMDAVPPVFHNIAMWLTVLLAGQRYISISYPLHSRSLCSVKNVRVATCIITVISLLCGLPKSFDFYYVVYEGWMFADRGEWMYTRTCLIGFTPLLNFVGQNLFYNLYFWTRAVGFIIVPSVLLIILNALLIRGIQKAQKRKMRLLREKRSKEAQKQTDSNSTSLMLVVIVTIFLVVNLPQAAFMAILCVCETFSIRFSLLEGMFPLLFLLVNNMLVMATYPINFGIYCFMSSSFRQTFKALFCRGVTSNGAATEVSHATGSRYSRNFEMSTFVSKSEVSERPQRRSDASPLMFLGNDLEPNTEYSHITSPNFNHLNGKGETVFL